MSIRRVRETAGVELVVLAAVGLPVVGGLVGAWWGRRRSDRALARDQARCEEFLDRVERETVAQGREAGARTRGDAIRGARDPRERGGRLSDVPYPG